MSNETVSNNMVVSFTYQIQDEQGKILEHSDLPMEYIHGVSGTMYPKVEQALQGKKAGDSVEVMLAPQEGFGEHDPGLTFTDNIENVPPEFRRVGARPAFENERGEVMEFTVSKIEGDQLTVDANHPFAGQTVKFLIHIVAIRPATPDDLDGTPTPTTRH